MNPLTFPPLATMLQNPAAAAAANLRISDKVKQLYKDVQEEHQARLVLEGRPKEVRMYHFQVRNIYLEQDKKHATGIVLQEFENGDRWCFTIDGAHFVFHLSRRLSFAISTELNGNEEEVYHPTDPQEPLLDPRDWGTWWTDSSDPEDLVAIQHYRDFLYPRICQTVQGISTFLQRPLRVLDVGGGNGECASMVLKGRNISSYLLLERDLDAIAEAQRLKLALEAPQQQALTISQRDIVQQAPFVEGEVDVTILSGVVAATVITQYDAVGVLDRSVQATAEGGFLIVAAFSGPYFHSLDFWQKGLEILNMSFCNQKDEVNAFYILRKKPQALFERQSYFPAAVMKLIWDYQ